VPLELPDFDVPEREVLRNRLTVGTNICKEFIQIVETHYHVVSSDWTLMEKDGDLSLDYEPKGIRSAVDPSTLVMSVKKMWMQAKERWPEVFTKDGFLGLTMQHGTEGLNADEFAKLFRAQVDGYQEEKA
jgi:hypothetical protein